jgi:hypothetical protein
MSLFDMEQKYAEVLPSIDAFIRLTQALSMATR